MKSQPTARAVVIPDTHAPLVDKAAFNCVLRAIELVKPTHVILLGDIGEWESVNHHRHKRIRKPDPQEVSHDVRCDVRAVRKQIIDPLDMVCAATKVKQKVLLTGNHDRWLDYFVEANPDYAHTTFDEASGYKFDQILDWKARQWQVEPCGKLYRFGRLHLYHGHLYGGIHHTRNHLQRMGVSLMYGHWHDVSYSSVTHADGVKGAWSLGCLKRLDDRANDWLERRPTNWSHAFAVVDQWGGGFFTVNPINIIDGRCALLGYEVIDGRTFSYEEQAYELSKKTKKAAQ